MMRFCWLFVSLYIAEKEIEVSYNKLRNLMIDKGMPNRSDLKSLTGIETNTLPKLSKN